jgi:hypothetical protein
MDGFGGPMGRMPGMMGPGMMGPGMMGLPGMQFDDFGFGQVIVSPCYVKYSLLWFVSCVLYGATKYRSVRVLYPSYELATRNL